MKAGDISDAAVCVGRSDTLGHARNLMLRHRTKKLVVIADGKPVGVLSAKDILSKMKGGPLWRRRPVDSLLVENAMARSPITALGDSDVSGLARIMLENKISSIPITGQDGSLSGIVTKEGILRAFAAEGGKKRRVSDLMRPDVFTVGKMHSLSHTRKLMEQKGVGRVVVKEKGAPIGVITATDLMFLEFGDPVAGIKVKRANIFRRQDNAFKESVSENQPAAGDIMSAEPVTISKKESAAKAAELMLEHNISSLPVVEKGTLVGIITKTDIVRAFLEV